MYFIYARTYATSRISPQIRWPDIDEWMSELKRRSHCCNLRNYQRICIAIHSVADSQQLPIASSLFQAEWLTKICVFFESDGDYFRKMLILFIIIYSFSMIFSRTIMNCNRLFGWLLLLHISIGFLFTQNYKRNSLMVGSCHFAVVLLVTSRFFSTQLQCIGFLLCFFFLSLFRCCSGSIKWKCSPFLFAIRFHLHRQQRQRPSRRPWLSFYFSI